jgi:hypothetical protein
MDILDLSQFMDNGIVIERAFFDKVDRFDWDQYRDKRVLVKGCGTTIIPPWAFMTVAARLSQVAKRVRYGNEHSSIAVFSRLNKETTDADR